MAYFFTPPTVERSHVLRRRLIFKLNHGLTVFRIAGVWHQQETPSDVQHRAADRWYPGGHVHPVTSSERTDLIAAGYGAYITEV